jgi:glycosyltransferase involved in cell wall biosynthesis
VSFKISVIVACRNEAKYIVDFLDSVLQQQVLGMEWNVIVADGVSTDGTRDILNDYQARHPRLRVIENPKKIVSTGLNLAIRAADSDIIIRMDAHTEYASDYVSECVRQLHLTGAENVGGPARTKSDGFLHRAVSAAYHSPFACGGVKFHDETYEGYVDTVVYGCWRKATLERAGLFDENLVRNQDDELNLRLHRAGGKIWQSPSIVSRYRPRSDFSSLFRQYFQYGFWKIPVICKHRLPASWRHLVPGTFVSANVVLMLTFFAGAITGYSQVSIYSATVWGIMIVAYVSLSLGFAFCAAKQRGWLLLPVLPLVFAIYHVSYGTGFLSGVLYWSWIRPGSRRAGKLFTEITR